MLVRAITSVWISQTHLVRVGDIFDDGDEVVRRRPSIFVAVVPTAKKAAAKVTRPAAD